MAMRYVNDELADLKEAADDFVVHNDVMYVAWREGIEATLKNMGFKYHDQKDQSCDLKCVHSQWDRKKGSVDLIVVKDVDMMLKMLSAYKAISHLLGRDCIHNYVKDSLYDWLEKQPVEIKIVEKVVETPPAQSLDCLLFEVPSNGKISESSRGPGS